MSGLGAMGIQPSEIDRIFLPDFIALIDGFNERNSGDDEVVEIADDDWRWRWFEDRAGGGVH